ncbi:nose resistant to fluoxetine protein 6-like isoform X1 [Cylas formicarius]|uniref:nose resistant to fluoxetine protein 6-like isoform X1 n=2 Tax=Cylas formicarius TaxID=197179 RepID=UPI002958D15A|nr:nose resistant to fluoxetine protein 6-like isoform X1 [Cylas formicarius]
MARAIHFDRESYDGMATTKLLAFFALLKWCSALEYGEVQINPNVVASSYMCGNLTSISNISLACRSQLDVLCGDPDLTLRLADAWSSFPYTGMLVSTRIELGTYDECIGVDADQNGVRVLGKHCAAGILLPTTTDPGDFVDKAFKLSYCVPDQCTVRDVGRMLPFIPEELINDQYCRTKDSNKDWTASSIVILTAFCIVAAVMVASTAYDIALYAKDTKNKYPALTAFSVFTNGRKLFHTSSMASKEQIHCFHGLKFISMMWIVAGHAAVGWDSLPMVNDARVKGWLTERYTVYLATAHLGVDTFFYISGFLLAYQYFKKEAQKPASVQIKSLPSLILHRYLRLTPSLLMLYLYFIGLAGFVSDGPLYQTITASLRQPCLDNWYAVFLYIQNYHNPRSLCMTSLWYLSADMQLFLVAPLVMIPIAIQLKRSFKLAMIELLVLNLLFAALPIFTKLAFSNFDPNFDEFDAHSRLTDYFLGFMFGFYVRQQRDRPYPFSGIVTVLLWALCLVGMFGTMLVLHEINIYHDYTAKALCYSLMRPVWCMGLSWIVYACIHEKGGAISSILSNSVTQVGGKLTYSIYLTHGNIIYLWVMSTRTSRYFSDLEMFYAFCGIFATSCVVALVWSLAFESPIIILTKMLTGGAGKRVPTVAAYQKHPEKYIPRGE